MSLSALFPTSYLEFGELRGEVQRHLDPEQRLPKWPFLEHLGFVTIYEYDRVLGGSFGVVLAALAEAYADRHVTVLGVDPGALYYHDAYGFFPGFRIMEGSISAGYAAGLRTEPQADPTGALGFTLNVVGITGSSGRWAVWGQRDWEIALLLTPDAQGSWLDAPVPSFGPDVDLDSIRSPAGWGAPLGEQERSEFWRTVRDHTSKA